MNSSNNLPSLSIVLPCYNEEKVLPETLTRLTTLLNDLIDSNKIGKASKMYFVDDGSNDKTWELIDEFSQNNKQVRGIKLSCNRGHQNALLAGLLNAGGDAIISIDADLQDDILIIEKMVDEYIAGSDVVYGVRKSRSTDTFFKRCTAESYYKLIQLMGVDIVFNHADYRLLSRRAINALKSYGEVNLFLRGVIPTLGFRCTQVEYDRCQRFAGESKYPISKMLSLAVDGITSFSVTPLRVIALMGLLVFIGTLFMSAWVLWTKFVSNTGIPGWASSVLPIYFIGGIQLLSIGVLGEYVAKTYMETKKRPRFIIEKIIE
jgi:glycosyltransferase involved in cell wall biosynthesis